jgi:phosphatidylglycerophosphate synthase
MNSDPQPNGRLMPTLSNRDGSYVLNRPDKLFPVTRHLSYPLTHLLHRLPISPNQITALSMIAGLIGSGCFAQGTWFMHIAGGFWLIACYTLDNCDGEIARLKAMSSDWGAHFDDFVDWLVDSAFFAALGYGTGQATGEALWIWLGAAAAIGATIDYTIDIVFYAKTKNAPKSKSREEEATHVRKPEDFIDWLIYIFHKLSRADFCLIVLGLALFNVLWVLLPLGAIGAQAYWMTDLFKRARGWHT